MMSFLTVYMMLIFFAVVVAFMIINYKTPVSLKVSVKEVFQSVGLYVFVFCLFNLLTVGTNPSEWRQTYLLPLLMGAVFIRLFIDWWILRRNKEEGL